MTRALLLAASVAFAAPTPPPAVGTRAPALTLRSQEGRTTNLSDFRGKWVVLYFYPKDFTRGCTIEAHEFQSDLSQYRKRGAVVLGVSVQPAGSHKEFCAKEGLAFKLLADVDHKASEAYGSLAEYHGEPLSARNTFLIDPKGVIRRSFIRVDPSGHSKRVLAALDELRGS